MKKTELKICAFEAWGELSGIGLNIEFPKEWADKWLSGFMGFELTPRQARKLARQLISAADSHEKMDKKYADSARRS